MLYYKDKTFCQFIECAEFDKCDRAYTEEVDRQAIEWWGSDDAPVSFFILRPSCFAARD